MSFARACALIASLALVSVGCADEHGHDHAPGADHHHGHAPAADPSAAVATAAEAAPARGPSEPVALTLGAWKATLEPSGETLKLVVRGPDGPVPPVGDAKVVLTGTGEDEQRVTLAPAGDAWSGPAKAAGAPGYVAVVSVTLDGRTESGRAVWGDVPEPAPADHGHEHGADGHDHGGGDHGHSH